MELKRIDRLIAKAKTWDELYKDLSSNKQFTQKFKGDVFERVTQAYLLTIPEYKSTLSDVWLTDEVPRTVLKKLNLPSKDFGVDLIAKTNKGEYLEKRTQKDSKRTQKGLKFRKKDSKGLKRTQKGLRFRDSKI